MGPDGVVELTGIAEEHAAALFRIAEGSRFL
jgi:hypothetical protein